jgi:PAS domain S-box-containing protein
MTDTTESESTAVPTASGSLRVKVPLVICALIMVLVGIFLSVAHRQVESTLVEGGGQRADAAADLLANMLAQSAQQRTTEAQRIAADSAVRGYLKQPTDSLAREVARHSLSSAATGRSAVTLWDTANTRLLELSTPAAGEVPPVALAASNGPSQLGPTPLQVAGRLVFYEVVAEVLDEIPGTVKTASAPRLGYVVVRRSFSAAPTSAMLRQLVGSDALITMGNLRGGVWTDFANVVTAPPLLSDGFTEYRTAEGQTRMEATAAITGTPWAVAVDFPRTTIVAPAQVFLRRMILIAIGFVLAAAIAARALSDRLTTPLHELTNAAEAIAAGQYERRVATNQRDEIGRLGAAFNAMTAHVNEVHRELEQRVEQRIDELKESREELDRFFSLSLDLLCIASTDGYLKRLNPAWEQVLGWSTAELTAQPYLSFVHPDDVAATIAEASNLAQGVTTLTFENRYRCKDGSYRWLSWKVTPHSARDLLYGAARDVTEQKHAANELVRQAGELQAARDEAQRANGAKSAFLSRMSHDLRTPLNAILGFAQVLQLDDLNAERADNVRQILTGGQHLLDLISEVMDITRIESGHLPLSPEPVSVQDALHSAISLVKPLAAQRGITLETRPFSHDVAVLADRQRLSQVLLNLLSNAVKYNRASGRVTVGFDQLHPDKCRVTVTDTGAGIPPSKLALLFQPFERLGAEQTAVEGTGLGLALARALIEAMGGTLGVESVVDRGSTFWVELAVTEQIRISDAPEQSTIPAKTAGAGLILYIEDNLANVRLMQRIVAHRPGIELVHASSGKMGLVSARQHSPSLILLDLHLPDISGAEVLRCLWEDPVTREIPTIILTADVTPGIARRLMTAGAVECLSKPLDVKRVLGVIDERLQSHRQKALA